MNNLSSIFVAKQNNEILSDIKGCDVIKLYDIMHKLSAQGRIDEINMILDQLEHKNTYYTSQALIYACRWGHYNVAKTLIVKGNADVNAQEGMAIRLASDHRSTDIVELLLQHGADPDVGEGECLITACSRGNSRALLVLLDHGVNIHVRDNRALKIAAFNGHVDCVRLLVENGAAGDIFSKDLVNSPDFDHDDVMLYFRQLMCKKM